MRPDVSSISVAIPTRNAGPRLGEVLEAVAGQRVDAAVDVVVCDSGSHDGSVAVARGHGARVIEISPERFSHGATRNLLMAESHGAHVAFLTQDAVPAGVDWLVRLRAAFSLQDGVGLAFGPYRPRADASVMVTRELTAWFSSFLDDVELIDGVRIDRLPDAGRGWHASRLIGHLGFFTDANGMISRAAWEQVPFRTVAYAEDHRLAIDMLRAGYAKAYVPDAGVVHSHDYEIGGWLRRSFDEARAVREIYGSVPGSSWREAMLGVRGAVGADVRHAARASDRPLAALDALRITVESLTHHLARAAGTVAGARADHLPGRLRAALSLERRR